MKRESCFLIALSSLYSPSVKSRSCLSGDAAAVRDTAKSFFQKLHQLLHTADGRDILIYIWDMNIRPELLSSNEGHLVGSFGLHFYSSENSGCWPCALTTACWSLVGTPDVRTVSMPPGIGPIKVNDKPRLTISELITNSWAVYKIVLNTKLSICLGGRLKLTIYRWLDCDRLFSPTGLWTFE